jgi:hypothetical protein
MCAVTVEFHGLPNRAKLVSFIERFQELAPKQPLFIYSNTQYWAAKINLDLRNYDDVYVWLARWTDTSGEIGDMNTFITDDIWEMKLGGRRPTMIEFTSQAFVKGTRVRGTLFRGDHLFLHRLTQVSFPKPSRRAIPAAAGRIIPRTPLPTPNGRISREKRMTTLVTVGIGLGIAAIVGAGALVAWNYGHKAEAIFD